ncbi:MAG TPA: PAS domain-containing protein [Solimonas sp.]|nr:PAS domain-containing protein [Solimonas sp.]
MPTSTADERVPRGERQVRERSPWQQLMYYSQFLYRYVFAYLLFLYMRAQGITPGFMAQHEIAAAMLVYVLAIVVLMVLARGQRLTPPLQRALVLLDLCALVIGVPHDPNPGLPTIFVFYLAYADLGLRHQFKLYLEALAMGAVALALMLYLRAFHTATGLQPADAWQALLLTVIVLHGLQVFSGRDKARRLIQATQERLRLALDSPGLGAWSSSDPLRELKVDGHIQQVLGLDRGHESTRMTDYVAMIHAADRDRVMGKYAAFLKGGGEDYDDTYRVVRPNGEVRHINSRAKAVRDRQGRARSVAGMVWDLTQQREQQEALQRMEERYRLATVAARVAVWVWHVPEDRFEHDYAINRLLNLPADARATALEQALALVHPEDREGFARRIRAAIEGADREFFDEVRVIPRDGRTRVIQCRATIYRDAEGRALRLAGANWDATELAQARQELERSNRELDDFTYIASHDLKEPLRGIASFAGYLAQDYGPQLDEGGRGMIQKIRDQARRMETLINELLHISRLGRSQLQRETTDLDALLDEILASLDFSLREKGVLLRRPVPLPSLACDRVRVGELLRNLITNATKYNDKPERWIEIGWRTDGPEPVGYVRDNGIGIAPEHQGRVFTLFERLHKRDAYGGGTGVGLTIVQKIVHMHGGRVWLESEPGVGTTFYFTLPQGDAA